jgi:hypothetical protein
MARRAPCFRARPFAGNAELSPDFWAGFVCLHPIGRFLLYEHPATGMDGAGYPPRGFGPD